MIVLFKLDRVIRVDLIVCWSTLDSLDDNKHFKKVKQGIFTSVLGLDLNSKILVRISSSSGYVERATRGIVFESDENLSPNS